MPDNMSNNTNKILRAFEVATIVFSAIGSAASICILVWKGGAFAHQVQTHETRLLRIEGMGSPNFNQHVLVDEEREKRTEARLQKLENIFTIYVQNQTEVMKIYSDMRADLSRISQKVDDIKERLVEKKP